MLLFASLTGKIARRACQTLRSIEPAPDYANGALCRWRQLFPDQPVNLDDEGQSFEATARARGIAIPGDG